MLKHLVLKKFGVKNLVLKNLVLKKFDVENFGFKKNLVLKNLVLKNLVLKKFGVKKYGPFPKCRERMTAEPGRYVSGNSRCAKSSFVCVFSSNNPPYALQVSARGKMRMNPPRRSC